jgi:hypothetical protein
MKIPTVPMPKTEKSEKHEKNGPEKYEIEEAAHTLSKAMEIKQNTNLFTAAVKHLKMKKAAITDAVSWADNIGK